MIEFINCFDVPADRRDAFLAQWLHVNAYMAAKPGYHSHRLHRAVRPDATYAFVNTAGWESVEAWQAAHDEGFRALLAGPEWAGISSVPALYDVVHEGSRRDASKA
ncbi:antibiotic biosynthesis monooxygenase [Nocardioides sp. BP30]|uniref:antibiotic biosynthesis monooxygenase family protein n=1 Tax=Nocardioides sp. BP30 TaxID=3036374 RepID=UPI002468946D|nr:antibiotic biosynthesis monooxygenase [Nocardioides sp. BP30]WGL52124.1 antibiotic biosynthesis monooxygenase [Nocardioides sp. BP30]